MTRRNLHTRHHRGSAHSAHSASSVASGASASASEVAINPWVHRRSRARWFFSLLVVATLLFLTSQAFGQAPAAAPGKLISEPMDAALLAKPAVTAMEQARKEGVGKRDLSPQWEKFAAFNAYYKRYVFGKMKDQAFIGEIGSLTQSLLDDLDRASKAGSPAATLIRDSIIEIAKGVAPNNYHPASRINATLLLALVDDAPEDPRTRKPPTPSAAAFVPLVQLYMKPEYPDGVRAAALQGIARHVSLGAVKSPQYRTGVASMMMQLAKSEPPAGRSPAAHAFMQRYAVDILGVLADPNASPDTAKTLVALSTDKEKPSLIAAYAAAKISTIQPGKQQLEKLPEVLQVWAARAADTIEGELKRIERLDPPLAVRDQPAMPTDDTAVRQMGQDGSEEMMGSDYASDMESYDPGMTDTSMGMESEYGDMYGMGGMMPVANPQPLEVITSRRRINHILQQLQLGVTGVVTPGAPSKPGGLLGSATPADQAAFDTWITTVNDVFTAVNANTLDDRLKFVTELKTQLDVLRELSGVNVEEDPNAIPAPAMNAVDPLDGPPIVGVPAVAAPNGAGPANGQPAAAAPAAVNPVQPVVPAAAPAQDGIPVMQ